MCGSFFLVFLLRMIDHESKDDPQIEVEIEIHRVIHQGGPVVGDPHENPHGTT